MQIILASQNKNKLKGTNKRDGYLIYRYDSYIFQPLEIKDEKINGKR